MARDLIRRLGIYLTAALFFSTAALIAVISFLAFLWFDDETNDRWRLIVIHQWQLPLAVTLSTLVIRAAVAVQTTAAISLVASVLLESHVKLSRVPEVSLMRFSNPGTIVVGRVLLESLTTTPILAILGIILIAVSGALQFSSTILLSDFADVPALTVNSTTEVNITYGGAVSVSLAVENLQWGNLWNAQPHAYPVFAEYHDPDFETYEDHLHDTGVTVRGFLPIDKSDARETLTEYHGYMTMVDMRVVCVRPSLEHVKLNRTNSTAPGGPFVQMEGSVKPSAQVSLLNSMASNQSLPFSCLTNNIPQADGDIGVLGQGEPAVTLCPLNTIEMFSGLTSPLTHQEGKGMAYLLLDHTNTTLASVGSTEEWRETFDGVWTHLHPPSSESHNRDVNVVRATMCFDARSFVNTTRLATAHGARQRTEPQLSVGVHLDTLSETGSATTLDTSAVRRQLGATKQKLDTAADRGILDLNLDPDYKDPVLETEYGINYLDNAMDYNTVRPQQPINAIMMCTSCLLGEVAAPGNTRLVRKNMAAIFHDALRETDSPAIALQALFTVLTQMAYQELQPYFHINGTGVVTLKEEINIPASRRGFAIVVGMLLFQCALVAAALLAFAWGSKHTSLSNVWQSITQTAEVVQENGAYYAHDKRSVLFKGGSYEDTKHLLHEEGKDDQGWALTGVVKYHMDPVADGMVHETVVSIRRKTE